MMEWETVRLGDYISIKSGLAYKGCHIGKGECLLLGMGCVSFKEKFVESGARPYNDPSDDRFLVSPGDIVLATRQQSDNLPILAMPAIIPYIYQNKRVLFGTNLYKIENNSEIDNRFLFWLLKHQHYVNYIAGVKSGTAVQMVTKKNVEDYKFSCPPKFIRDKISKTLWDYDRLIENNTRRIRLLEQMAENLYKEWFVRFRFPGHENVEMVNGLPKGWKIKRIADFGRIETGKTPPMSNRKLYGGDILFVKTPDMHDKMFISSTSETLSEDGNNYQLTKLLPANSIMVSCIGTAGIVSINAKPAHTNQQINSIILNNLEDLEWLYYVCKQMKPTIELFGATGATMTNLSKGKFEKLKVVVPKANIRESFHKRIRPYFKEIFTLDQQNTLLTRQRDLLLPRLMSGKLEVKS